MVDFVKTPQAERAMALCEVVIGGRDHARVGQITGAPGTGKSALTRWLVGQFGGVRIEAWAGMGDKHMLQELARAHDARFDTGVQLAGTSNTLFQRLTQAGLDGTLIVVDEANHLRWRSLELLRGLSDRGAGVILVGTDLLLRTLSHPQIRIYLEQLRQRIGAKQLRMVPIETADAMAAYILVPRFEALTRTGAARFWAVSNGNWRSGLELADACTRLMANEGITRLDAAVVETAAAWMAGQDHGSGGGQEAA